MNFVFFGTPKFSEVVLKRLIVAGFVPSLVVTNPDRPVGRKGVITPPPVKVLAQKHGLPVAQPTELSADSQLLITNCQFAVLAAYGKIIPKEFIAAFPKGIIVVHPSLLPRYRGATPIQSAILGGDETTGTTLILMDEKVDHGPVLAKRKLEFPRLRQDFGGQVISNTTYTELHDALAELSADLLVETLPKYLSGEIRPEPQDEALATYTKKFSTDDAFVSEADLEKAQNEGGDIAVTIDRKIRALNPEPGTWSLQNGKRVKLLTAKIEGGRLKLTQIQMEGRKPVTLASAPSDSR